MQKLFLCWDRSPTTGLCPPGGVDGQNSLLIFFFSPFSFNWRKSPESLQSCPASKCKGCVLYVVYLLYYMAVCLGFFPSVFSSSDLETVFLTFVADKYRLVFGRAAWVGEVLSSASLAVGSESAAILEEEPN